MPVVLRSKTLQLEHYANDYLEDSAAQTDELRAAPSDRFGGAMLVKSTQKCDFCAKMSASTYHTVESKLQFLLHFESVLGRFNGDRRL